MMAFLVYFLGIVIFLTGAAVLVGGVVLLSPPKVSMSPAWRQARARAEMRAEAELDHVLVLDGEEVVRSKNEAAVEDVRTTIEDARRLAQVRAAS